MHEPGQPGAGEAITDLHLPFPGTSLLLSIHTSEWNALTDEMKYVVLQIVKNYQNSPGLKNAINHLENEGVSAIRLTVGPQGMKTDGSPFQFLTNALAAIAYLSASGDHTRTDIVSGSSVVISVNSLHPRFLANDMKVRDCDRARAFSSRYAGHLYRSGGWEVD